MSFIIPMQAQYIGHMASIVTILHAHNYRLGKNCQHLFSSWTGWVSNEGTIRRLKTRPCGTHKGVDFLSPSFPKDTLFRFSMICEVVALETAGSGITCNAICPGWVLTPR